MLTQLDVLYDEIQIYMYLNHCNICKLYQVIDDEDCDKLYFIMDHCDLG